MDYYIITLVLVISMDRGSTLPGCPAQCICEGEADETLRCSHYNKTSFPHLPAATTNVFITCSSHRSNRAWLGQITAEDFTNASLVMRMHIKQCSLATIEPRAFLSQQQLQHLVVTHADLERIQSHTFQGLSRVTHLTLDNNQLRVIGEQAFDGVGQNTDGTLLSIKNNAKLHYLHPLAFKRSNVKELDLSFANLSSDSLVALRALQRKLQVLHLRSNSQPLDFGVSLEGFRLNSLILDNNGIRNLSFLQNMTVTRKLSVARNPIGVVDFREFPTLSKLKYLDLRSTNYSYLIPEYFAAFKRLKLLKLSHNHIKSLSSEIQPVFEKLTDGMELDGNDFHCNCDMAWFPRWLTTHRRLQVTGTWCSTPTPGNMMNYPSMVCSKPSNIRIDFRITNNHVMLFCDYNGGDPIPTVAWSLHDISSSSLPSVKTAPGTNNQTIMLKLPDKETHLNNTLSFTCAATNAFGTDTAQIKLDFEALLSNFTQSTTVREKSSEESRARPESISNSARGQVSLVLILMSFLTFTY